MEILLENIFIELEADNLTDSQALYLIYTRAGIPYPIDNDEMMDLINKKFLRANKVARILLTAPSADTKLTGTVTPKYELEISQEVAKKMCSLLCVVKKGTTKVLLPGGDSGEAIKYTADTYLQKEGLIAYHYIIFLFLFPVAGKTNIRWENHFTQAKYKGPKLRLRSRKSGANFIKIAKQKDMGAFLYGTYLFIKSSIQGEKTFITTIPKYLAEYEEWYDEAYEILAGTTDVDPLFKDDDDSQDGELYRSVI